MEVSFYLRKELLNKNGLAPIRMHIIDKLDECEINQLLNDKSAKIRLNTLYALKNKEGFTELIKEFLADESSSIRYLARFTLKNTIFDFTEYYKSQLKSNTNIAGSLLGLAEIRAVECAAIVKDYLFSPRIKIKKAALIALIKLDEIQAAKFSIENLSTTIVGLRRVIIDFLSIHYNEDVLQKAKECYVKGDEGLRISMLSLFSRIAGWKALETLIKGTIDANENVRHLAIQHVYKWKAQAAVLYATPSKEDSEKIRAVYAIANSMYENKQFLEQNPLDELDFYFR